MTMHLWRRKPVVTTEVPEADCAACSLFGVEWLDLWWKPGDAVTVEVPEVDCIACLALAGLKFPVSTPGQAVHHPGHYTFGRFEVIDVIEDWGLGFNLGNAVKYIARAGRKDPARTIEDLLKARWYLDREIVRQRGNGGGK